MKSLSGILDPRVFEVGADATGGPSDHCLENQVRKLARGDARARLLMTTPGVGPIVGLTYVAAIDNPARFSSSKTVGAHFGMTPKKYQSGGIDVTGRISKMGDKGVRAAVQIPTKSPAYSDFNPPTIPRYSRPLSGRC